MPDRRADRDSPWKEVLDRYLREFLALLFPRIHAGIDWRRKPSFLDKELQRIVRGGVLGRRHADKLAQVGLRDGREAWILIHIEVEEHPKKDFSKGMYVYNYYIFDRYHRNVVSLAALTGKTAWNPGTYEVRHWDHELLHRFPIAKLRDWREKREELEGSTNPFAVVVLAHLESQDARTPREKYIAKLRLIRRLYERGYDKRDIMELLRFIDWLLVLPRGLERKLGRRIERLDREKAMVYVTSWERMGIEEGRKEGRKGSRRV